MDQESKLFVFLDSLFKTNSSEYQTFYRKKLLLV